MDTKDRLDALASFFSCSHREAEKLNDAMSFKTYHHKDILAHQGDVGSTIWIVLDGRAQLQIGGVDGQIQLLASHGPGELFGAFPHERVVVSHVIAQNQLSVLEISTAKLTALLKVNQELSNGMSKILGRQYNAVLDRMAARITLTAKGRVYSELLRQGGDNGVISPPPMVSGLAMIAQTTRETASRAINALERRGIIQRDAERLEIISTALLKDMII